jgi:alkyl hydroperoxide reductase subunit F
MFTLNLSNTQNMLSSEKIYDVFIIGSGPAGLSAAIYAARKGWSVGVIGDKPGGQVNDTTSVENYIGFDYITGQGLSKVFLDHAKSLNVDFESASKVKKIIKADLFEIQADNYMTYKAKAVLLATGSKSRMLEVKGEKAFYGKGVTYCAICDGPLFKDKSIAIVGGGNSAVEAAIDLSKIAKNVHLVHRSDFRADKILLDKLKTLDNLTIHLSTRVKEIKGEHAVNEIEVEGGTNGSIVTDGVLVEIGYVPNSQFVEVDKNERGEIIIDINHQTSTEGMYAAGDVTTEKFKQIIVAASEGAKAALAMNDYLNTL